MINYLLHFHQENITYTTSLNQPKLSSVIKKNQYYIIRVDIYNFFDINQKIFKIKEFVYLCLNDKTLNDIHVYIADCDFDISSTKKVQIYCLQQLPFFINGNLTYLAKNISMLQLDITSFTIYSPKTQELFHTSVHFSDDQLYDSYNFLGENTSAQDIKDILNDWYFKMNNIINPLKLLRVL